MILIICIISLFLIFILDYMTNEKMEQFKNHQSYKQQYLNDPNKINSYRSKEESKQLKNVDSFTSVNKIQSNEIMSEDINKLASMTECKSKIIIDPIENIKHDSKIIFPERVKDIDEYNHIDNGLGKKESKKIMKKKLPKYKLYADGLFTYHPAGTVQNDDNPNIDQTTSLNIMNYVDKGIDKNNETSVMNGRTIKQIYDDITNDNRLELQQNLDELEASDFRTDFEIGKKYGATRFDTYSVDN